MSKRDMESYTLWRPNSVEVFQEALSQKACFSIGCNMRLGGGLSDVTFTGSLSNVSGSIAFFEIEEHQRLPLRGKPDSPHCEYSFSLNQGSPNGAVERTGYSGKGLIVDSQNDAEGIPKRMLLRLSRQYVTRRLRRDDRLEWRGEHIGLLGLLVVSDIPATRQDLRMAIKAYYAHASQKLSLLNISAGGACLCVSPEMARRTLATHEVYLFFFSARPGDKDHLPYIFLGKKVGRSREDEGTGLRMRFIAELDWSNSKGALLWAGIENNGSERLRHSVDARRRDYEALEREQMREEQQKKEQAELEAKEEDAEKEAQDLTTQPAPAQ